MLHTLRMQNYRCFEDHTVALHATTVVVGKNNAGKSTIVEALHIIAAVVNRAHANFVAPPASLGMPKFHRCIAPRIAHLDLNLRTAFHRYGDPPAILTATFTGGATVQAYVHKEGVHATISGPDGWVATNAQFCALKIPYVHILPQIAPLLAEETYLTDGYVDEHYFTRLSSRHFRNQIFRSPENFADFKTLAESTWHGLRIQAVTSDLTMLVTDGDFAAEVAWMGHGLQMWLQTMWFIAKTPTGSVVVLDEPDVYMHPDLQRKLYRLLRNRFAQSIVATHSVEIMAEADPADILVINNKRKRSTYANTEPGVQVLIDHLGGIHNVHLARLWNAKKFILLEGKDLGYLKALHARLFPAAETQLDAIPNISIGGWGGWANAIGSSMAIKNAVGDRITLYCIFDSDYHTNEEKTARQEEAAERGINMHIWERKEIENYLLDATVIARLVTQRTKKKPPTTQEVVEFLMQACDEEKDTVFDAVAEHLNQQNHKLGPGGANKKARQLLNPRWKNDRLSIVSGKALLSRLNTWVHDQYGVAIGAMALAKAFRATEVPQEVARIITSIEEGTPLTTLAPDLTSPPAR